MRRPRPRTLTNKYRINARSLREIFEAMTRGVRTFADEGRIKFRGRKLGNEAYINVAVWYLADQDRATQERVLRTYLPRIEAFLSEPEAGGGPVPGTGPAPGPSPAAEGLVSHEDESECRPSRRKRDA